MEGHKIHYQSEHLNNKLFATLIGKICSTKLIFPVDLPWLEKHDIPKITNQPSQCYDHLKIIIAFL